MSVEIDFGAGQSVMKHLTLFSRPKLYLAVSVQRPLVPQASLLNHPKLPQGGQKVAILVGRSAQFNQRKPLQRR
jgi:hypothetical protein